jgi:predicted dienelactone hydrolase
VQFAREGFTWQFVPAWGLIAAAAAPVSARGAALRWAGRIGLVGLAAATVGTWLVLAVPRLPTPSGPYPVGSETFRWVDASRAEDATADPADRRNVVVQAWYPAAPGARGPHAPYIDGLGDLPPRVSLLPRFLLRRYGEIDTHAVERAPLAPAPRRWPVVIFSPGYGGPRAFYTGLLAELASRGYVVLALDHPYEAAVTRLADGRVVHTIERFLPGDPDRLGFMADHLATRAADVRFVLDRLPTAAMGPRLGGRLDPTHVAVIGHSLGGATAALALAQDPARLQAAANIDGTLYGDLPGRRLQRPFLLLQSDAAETTPSARFVEGNRRLLAGLAAGGARYEIKRANHYSFTDAPLFFSPPGRFVLSRLIGGERGPVETQRATVGLLDAFLRGPLGDAPGDIQAAARRYRGIVGGSIPTPGTAAAFLESRRRLGLADQGRR